MDFGEILNIVSALRGERGCPWDKEQTTESLKPFIIEEAYEILEAIDENNPEALKEELGDLLFQVVFQAQLAKERGDFDMADVIKKISSKLIERHPHVFGDADFKTSEEVLVHWEDQKKKEGKQSESIIDGIPKALPSLLHAYKLQERVSRVGFDWSNIDDVIEKLEEELKEFKRAFNRLTREEIKDELGDIFFVLVNISRFIGVNPEDALGKSISKFISRFRYVETSASDLGKKLSDMTLEEMDELWNEAKKKEKNN
jgi:tetrapyrrole methylase family protein/MazG family protein